jgi:hypothetical protein
VAGEREDGLVHDDLLSWPGPERAAHYSFGGRAWQVEITALKQKVPRTQSASETQGNAHFPYCRLHRWLMHIESFVHGAAAGPGTVRVAGSAGGSGGGADVVRLDAPGDAGGGLAGAP